MSEICFVNNKFINRDQAFVHIDDRAFQFADGIYEVILFNNGKLIDGVAHLDRLFKGLSKLNIKHNFLQDEITANILELFAKNNMDNGFVYLQVTRGVAKRNQLIVEGISPTVTMTVDEHKKFSDEDFNRGVKIMSADDIRWHMVNIKTTALLASAMTEPISIVSIS